MSRALKVESARVTTISATLRVLELDRGEVWLQRSYREPFILSTSEAAKLRVVLTAGHDSEPEPATTRGTQ